MSERTNEIESFWDEWYVIDSLEKGSLKKVRLIK